MSDSQPASDPADTRPAYDLLGSVYDQLQSTDYAAWANFVLSLNQNLSQRSSGDGTAGRPILLDLGCGSGGFCREMLRRGFDPIGVDVSSVMLAEAMRLEADESSARGAGDALVRSLYIQQDMRQLELFGTVDLAVALTDTVNHLLRLADLRALFARLAHYLNPGALFIFDLATRHTLARVRGNRLLVERGVDSTLIWQNRWLPGRGIAEAQMQLFRKTLGKLWQESSVIIRERFYSRSEIIRLAQEAGLEWVAVYGDCRMTPPHSREARHTYVVRRPLHDR